MNKKIGSLALLAVVLIFGMIACKNGDDLQGKWVEWNRGEITFTGNNFIWQWDDYDECDGEGKFTVRGDQIKLDYGKRVVTYKYTVSKDGRMLTLFESKDDFIAFSKK